MKLALRPHAPMRSRAGRLIGVAAAAGAFGAAAMMSAATAPTARADDLAAIEADISGELAYGQTAFSTAMTDFGSNNDIGGLEALFNGVDDDTIGGPDIATIGGVEELTNEPFSLTGAELDFNGDIYPTSFSGAVTEVELLFSEAESAVSDVPTALSSGDYGVAALDSLIVPLVLDVIPQYLLIGGLESLGF